MLRKFFDRDRLVMAGLIILGILTVAAGFVSGRSTFQYALSTDARQASVQWVKNTEDTLFRQPGSAVPDVSGQKVVVVAPHRLAALREEVREERPEDLRIARSVHEESGLLAGIDTLFSGWITQLTRVLDSNTHVSQVRNFALLGPGGGVILHSRGLNPDTLRQILSDSGFIAELHKALGNYSTRIIENFAPPGETTDEFRKALIVPLIADDKITRVYMVEVDQSSAATMSKVALVAASMMTSLLIVLGYSVPAAVAFRRIRERWKAEDQIRFLAMHDPLTGLSNRVQLQRRLEQSLARAKRRESLLSVMCVDLDRFKEINDSLGHKAGDALLVEMAERLRHCVRETDVVARLGGDEFVVVVEDLAEPTDVIPVARRICQQLGEPVDLDGHQIAISGSVGITFAPIEGGDTQTLINNADLALYRAKNDGRNTFRFFEPEMDEVIQRRRSLASDLRQALRNNGLHVHYQPQFDLKSGMLTGYEALARWNHPERGEIPPALFIPIAEESGLIGVLGEWVLDTACHYARHWPRGTTLSVNVSPAQFAAQDLAAMVRATLSKTGFAAQRLLLEFTEELLFRNTDEAIATLKSLTGLGVQLAIDDFGSGYSSLSYLTRLPVSKLKIDPSFVRRMESDKDAGAIVDTIIGIGRSLNVTIAAEGVETEAQARYLLRAGCNEVQGFLFGRPESNIRGSSHPRFSHSQERPGEIVVPVELETELPELPLAEHIERPAELAGMLPGEPAANPERRLDDAMLDADAGEEAGGASADVTPRPERLVG